MARSSCPGSALACLQLCATHCLPTLHGALLRMMEIYGPFRVAGGEGSGPSANRRRGDYASWFVPRSLKAVPPPPPTSTCRKIARMVQYRQGEPYSSRRSSYSSPTSGGEHDFPPSQPAPHYPSHLRPDSPSYSFSSISSSGTAYSSLFNSGLDNLRQGPSQLMTPEVRGGWGGKVAKFSIGLKGLAGSHKGKAYLPSPPTSSYDSPASDFFSSSPRLPPPSLPQPPPPAPPPTGLSAGHLQPGSSSSGRSRSGSSGASGDQAVRSGGAEKGSRADAGEKAARVRGIRQVKLVPSGKAARLLGTENSAARGGAEGQERRKRRDGDGGPPEGQYYLEQGHL